MTQHDPTSGAVPESLPLAQSVAIKAALAANLLIGLIWGYAAMLREVSKDFYYLSAQEDEYIEWGTFWAFILAAGVGVLAAVWQRRSQGVVPWFLLGVSVFCFVVAMEEISWGQRVVGYRPPVYFLEKNFQQELNFHNVMDKGLRKLAVKGVILGFGVVLPLLALARPLGGFLRRLGIVAPPVALAPGFAATYWFYEDYPWSFSGEWVELMMGLGFLFAAMAAARRFRTGRLAAWGDRPVTALVAAWVLVLGLGFAQAGLSRFVRGSSPELLTAAHAETEALKRDFVSGKVTSRCDRHRRLYTFKEAYHQDYLLAGEFARLTAQGLPEERAEFFLDPWNSPYWLRDRCDSDDDRRIVFIYSFGPDRRRQSSRWEILGDDVGAVVYDGRRVRDIVPRQR